MKLTQLFSGGVRTDSTTHTSQSTPAQAEQLSRQIRSLVPGQTLSGEIVARNGSEVQIRLSEDMVLNARVDRNLNLEIGKNVTFEVKSNGSALTLSPLFTNVSTDMNVLKALDMAGLPVNRTTVDMTEQLMAAGMSVNKNMLQQIFREINAFPQGTVSDIVNLHRLQMPVNEANINQMISYRNLTHQLGQGMEGILEEMPEVFDSLMEKGDIPGAIKLYQEVLQLVREGGAENLPEPGSALSETSEAVIGAGQESVPEETSEAGETGAAAEGTQEKVLTGEALSQEQVPGRLTGAKIVFGEEGLVQQGKQGEAGSGLSVGEGGVLRPGEREIRPGNAAADVPEETAGAQRHITGEPAEAGTQAQTIPQSLRAAAAGEALELLGSLRLPEQEAAALRTQVMQFAMGGADAGQFFSGLNTMLSAAKTVPGAGGALEKLFSGGHITRLLTDSLKNSWTLRPEEVGSPGRVEELYRRLDRQLRSLTSALEDAGQSGSEAYRAATTMSQNVDFLQQLNQMYAYVQLPLHLQNRQGHGELYVYTNKKNLAEKDGNVSALLHLDMEYLGPVDVYVAMQNSKVSTKFYLCDDEMIDFIGAHMDILTQRLQKRGYDCSFSMVLRSESKGEATQGGLEPVLHQEKELMLSQYSFDVRT